MRRSRPIAAADQAEQKITLFERLLCAVLTPIVVNISIVLLMAASRRKFSNFSTLFAWRSLPTHYAPLVLTVMLPAALGFLLGSRRVLTLVGHMFYTNNEHERSEKITAAIWAGFALYAWVLHDYLLP